MGETSNIANGLENLKTQFYVAYSASHNCLSCYARPTLRRTPEDAAAGATADAERGMWVERMSLSSSQALELLLDTTGEAADNKR